MLLTQDNKALAGIVLPEADSDVRAVAGELARILKQITGAKFAVTEGASPTGSPRIVLRVEPRLLNAYRRRKRPVVEAVRWECDGKQRLEIAGSDAHALWMSLYSFCEDKLGCRWFFPGKLGEDIPVQKRLELGRFTVAHTPSFVARNFVYWPEDYQRRKLSRNISLSGVHAFNRVCPPAILPKHPNYAVMIDGKRRPEKGYQLCLSQKGVEDLAVEYCLRYFEEHPDELIVGIGQNDGENFCDCPDCVATNLGRKPKKGESSPWWVTRSVVDFTNRVAARVGKVHPDKLVMMLAYSRTKEPMADVTVHPNVIVDYCSQPQPNWFGEEGFRQLESEVRAWGSKAVHVGLFDYLVNQSWPGLFRPIPELYSRILKTYHKGGARYYYTQHDTDFGLNMVNYYLTCALVWDVDRDPEKVMDDFYRRCFRAAHQPVKRFFKLMEQAVMDKARQPYGPGVIDITLHRNAHECACAIFNPEIMAQAQRHMKEAARLVKGDRLAQRRLALVRQAFEYLQVTITACRKAYDFVERYRVKPFTPWAWNVGNYDYHNTLEKMEMFGQPCVTMFLEVKEAWDRYRELRYRLEQKMVLGSKYSRGGTSFDPKATLDNIWGLYTGKLKEVPRLVTAKSALRAM